MKYVVDGLREIAVEDIAKVRVGLFVVVGNQCLFSLQVARNGTRQKGDTTHREKREQLERRCTSIGERGTCQQRHPSLLHREVQEGIP